MALLLALGACASGDYDTASATTTKSTVSARSASNDRVVSSSLVATDPNLSGAPVTAADGYPNINVDTARPSRTPVRTVAERQRLEADLMALAARQRSGSDTSTPGSVIQELQELGRRSKADAEAQIESGALPSQ